MLWAMKRLTLVTGGESHGPELTVVVTGLPAGLKMDLDFVNYELKRRQHGYGRGRRMVIEQDEVAIRGGVRNGETLSSPVVLAIENRDYKNWQPIMDPMAVDPRRAEQRRLRKPRPGHADLAGGLKLGRADLRDVLERASARETAARVAGAALAKLLLREVGVEIQSGVVSLGPVGAGGPKPSWEEMSQVDQSSPMRAVDRALEEDMVRLVDELKEAGDTVGGTVTVVAHGVPPGLGSYSHWEDRLDARLTQAVVSIPAVKAAEIGSAIQVSQGPGSQAHDPIGRSGESWARSSNNAGGLEGGVTNGEDVVVTAYMKPISTLRKGMPSVDLDTLEPSLSQYERSDVTALPACGVIAEAMVALILADALLEKVGGDSIEELKAHLDATLALQRQWP
jgi:chorismate synthase